MDLAVRPKIELVGDMLLDQIVRSPITAFPLSLDGPGAIIGHLQARVTSAWAKRSPPPRATKILLDDVIYGISECTLCFLGFDRSCRYKKFVLRIWKRHNSVTEMIVPTVFAKSRLTCSHLWLSFRFLHYGGLDGDISLTDEVVNGVSD